MSFVYIKSLHLASLLVLFTASAYKNVVLNADYVDHRKLRIVLLADRVSAISATLMVITGGTMLLYDYPENLFRLQQTFFLFKMNILVFTTTLIIVSKLMLRSIAREHECLPLSHIRIPVSIKLILGLDLIGLALMAFLAYLMVHF